MNPVYSRALRERGFTLLKIYNYEGSNRQGMSFKNLHLLLLYYFFPEDIIKAHPKDFQSIPRNPQNILKDKNVLDYVESMEFAVRVCDIVSAAVWHFLDIRASVKAYSEDDPIWRLTYNVEWYREVLEKAHYIYTPSYLFNKIDYDLPYTPWPVYQFGYIQILPIVMEKHNLLEIMDCVKKHRCFEDFNENVDSKQKLAFETQWRHEQTQHPQISLEEYSEKNDIINASDVEEQVVSQETINEFTATLDDTDKRILELRMEGRTYEEIAKEVGFKTPSAVHKRITKIGAAYQKHTETNIGYD